MTNDLACEQSLLEPFLPYFYDVPSPCPYDVGGCALYRQAQFGHLGDEQMAAFLAHGMRRNGNTLYIMACPDCSSCTPIRLPVADFAPNRNQRRVLRANEDVDISLAPLTMTEEKFSLLARFFAHRYPLAHNEPESYYGTFFSNSITATMEVEYRLAGELFGVAVVDVGTSFLNAVYFYFEQELARRSPGTFNILTLIDLCGRQGISHLYLGYLIKELSAMRYKGNFWPHELMVNGRWQRRDRG
ncbi:MAG: arginyltransferase [Thermodesulfobacteriota bacterium]